MKNTIKLLIVDDHAIVRIGLTSLFESESDIEVVGQAVNGEDAVRKIAADSKIISPEIRKMLAKDPPIPELSPRQKDILASITRGLTNKGIAAELGISARSVDEHVNALFQKLGAANRAEAVAIALRKQLLKI